MENTVPVQVCNTVMPSLVFHTGGMFVIPIIVSIFRMSIEKKSLYMQMWSDTCGEGVFCVWVTSF